MNKSMVSLLVFFGIQRMVDLTNPAVVNLLRVVYIALCAANYFAYEKVKADIEAKKNDPEMQRPIWVKNKPAANIMAALFGSTEQEAQAAESYKKTTYYELEEKAAKEKASATTTAPLMQLFFSFQMNVHLPLAIQCVMMPLNSVDDPLLAKYILGPWLGLPVPPRPYEELMEDPQQQGAGAAASNSTVAAVANANGTATPPAGRLPAAADVEAEEAVLSAWEAKEPLDVAVFEHLRSAGKDVNYRTSEGGWTALMVIAGSTIHTPKDVTRLLDLGADPAVTDADGWTPLHWAAHHGVPGSVAAIADAYGSRHAAKAASKARSGGGGAEALRHRKVGDDDDLIALLRSTDAAGRTALEVARTAADGSGSSGTAGNAKTAAALEEVMRGLKMVVPAPAAPASAPAPVAAPAPAPAAAETAPADADASEEVGEEAVPEIAQQEEEAEATPVAEEPAVEASAAEEDASAEVASPSGSGPRRRQRRRD